MFFNSNWYIACLVLALEKLNSGLRVSVECFDLLVILWQLRN